MALPINIDDLITGKTVEWERIEFKKNWNPLQVIQSIAAFANDINNWGGGYVIIGIEEKDGKPVLPPVGIDIGKIDDVQKEMLNLCHELRPQYFPIAEPVEFQGKHILLIWVPGGQVRPYKAPSSLSSPRNYFYYVRHFSSTMRATDQEERDLLSMSANVPYDDRINQNAGLSDLKLSLIQAHLSTIGSELAIQSADMPFAELCRKMNIVEGPDEYIKPKNIGLLIFNNDPSKFFQCACIEFVIFKDEEGDEFTEKTYSGPIQQQLADALLFLKNNIIAERVKKIEGRAEAVRIFNYPYEALEEALSNTVYHRSYEDDSPIEVRIFPNRIEMVSYPGPLPPLNKAKLRAGNIVARKYRNRRIGDFLKELHLTEGRGTGIPKIKREMKRNGSPDPIFDTDDELSYFLVTLPVHSSWEVQGIVQGTVQGTVQVETLILRYCIRPKKRREVMSELGLYSNYDNYVKYMKPLIVKGWLELTIPDKIQSMNQQYRTTPLGRNHLEEEQVE